MARTGSIAVVPVLPTVATSAHGTRPAASSSAIAWLRRSTRSAWLSSVSIRRRFCFPKPASSAAFSIELWASCEA